MIFIGAVGMMCSLTAVDIAMLANWDDAYSPKFVARLLVNISAVSAAFVGGKLIPENRNPNARTRAGETNGRKEEGSRTHTS